MTKRRRQRHHVVPRLHLRQFANADGRIQQIDLDTGRAGKPSITDAAVIRDFYTVTLPDGTKSDAWEDWMGTVESAAAPALRRTLQMAHFALDDPDRQALSRWVALQYLRGPGNRRQISEVGAFALKMQVGMGGLAYLQHAMTQGLARNVSRDEAQRVWDDIMSAQGPAFVASGHDHLNTVMGLYGRVVDLLYTRSWRRVRFTRHRLLLSDSPVSLVNDDPSPFVGVGLETAAAITMPLDRRTLLWLERPAHDSPEPDDDVQPSTWLARAQNAAITSGAERFTYFHPDDELFLTVPNQRPRPQKMEVLGGGDVANRDRPLADVLDQIQGADFDEGSLIADYTWPIPGYAPVLP